MTSSPFTVQTIELDLPALAGAFADRLHGAGLPVTVERSAQLARALTLAEQSGPSTRRRLYWTTRAVMVSDRGQIPAFDAVFAEVFGGSERPASPTAPDADQVPTSADAPPAARSREPDPRDQVDEPWSIGSGPSPTAARREDDARWVPVPTVASDDEVIRTKRFDALDADELARLYVLMRRISIVTPDRLTRRHHSARHGARVDLRRTLRSSLRTGGDPIRLAHRRRRTRPRRLVLLCDISGSMEPYARAYLQFLACAVGTSAPRSEGNEAFVFATRLTRLTRALHGAGGRRSPELAIARAAETAPDWSSGTRIGDALKAFNDRHGRRGMARGAIVVILSDGWERGDPSLVGGEMERLSRLAHRVVWVNPRVAAAGFSPRAGGMAAALPYCDALLSGHNLQSLHEVVDAIGARPQSIDGAAAHEAGVLDDEPWASATPTPGSSVAMPSGYGPGRGNTTPGWR